MKESDEISVASRFRDFDEAGIVRMMEPGEIAIQCFTGKLMILAGCIRCSFF